MLKEQPSGQKQINGMLGLGTWPSWEVVMTRDAPQTTCRPLPDQSSWADTEPAEERVARHAAWQAYRACADCRNWEHDEGEDVGCCLLVDLASLLTPSDYTCTRFMPRSST